MNHIKWKTIGWFSIIFLASFIFIMMVAFGLNWFIVRGLFSRKKWVNDLTMWIAAGVAIYTSVVIAIGYMKETNRFPLNTKKN